MKKMRVLAIALLAVLAVGAPTLAQQRVVVNTTHPLVGSWTGMWVLADGGMAVTTTISPSTQKEKLHVLYEYGAHPRGHLKPGKLEGDGILTTAGTLEFVSEKGSRFVFTLLSEDKLKVNWFPSAGGGRFETILSRKK